MKGIYRLGLVLGAWLAAAAPAFALTVTANVSPGAVSKGNEQFIPIRPAGSNATAKFTLTFSEAADAQVRLKNKDTDADTDASVKSYGRVLAFAGQSITNSTFSNETSITFALSKADQNLSDESNKILVYGRVTGSGSAITSTTLVSFNVWVDGVAPGAPSSVTAEGADQTVYVTFSAPKVTGAFNDVIGNYGGYLVTYADTDFSAMAATAAADLPTEVFTTESGSIAGLTNGKTYYVSVRTRDWATNTSDFPRDKSGKIVVVQALPTNTLTLAEIAGEKGGCFIATAAYGSYQERHVRVLREFRDRVLLASAPGRDFVRWYYRTSPAYAAWIARHDAVRAAVRVLLWPAYAGAYLVLHPLWALAAGLALLGLAFARTRTARREAHA
jgi:hypothetical protein